MVSGTRLSEDEVVWLEELSERSGTDGVQDSWLKIGQDGSGHVSAAGGLIVVDIDSLELQIRVAVVGSHWVDSVFVGNDFPELGTDLVTALACLEVDDFSHYVYKNRR